jgi:hypothetical protein
MARRAGASTKRRKVGDTQSQVQPRHDHEDNSGNDDGDDKTQNNSHFTYLLFVCGGMDNDDSNLDIVIVVVNNIRIQTEFSDQSNKKVILSFGI